MFKSLFSHNFDFFLRGFLFFIISGNFTHFWWICDVIVLKKISKIFRILALNSYCFPHFFSDFEIIFPRSENFLFNFFFNSHVECSKFFFLRIISFFPSKFTLFCFFPRLRMPNRWKQVVVKVWRLSGVKYFLPSCGLQVVRINLRTASRYFLQPWNVVLLFSSLNASGSISFKL